MTTCMTGKHSNNKYNLLQNLDLSTSVVVVVELLFYIQGKQTSEVISGWSVSLTTLFLGRLRPPKQFTSTLCTYFCQ